MRCHTGVLKAGALLSVLLLASWLALSCSRSEERFNVILISIDTLRPDHLGSYGYGLATSPTIDRLAREGVRFEFAFSSTTWTLPAHLALLTSLPDLVHGVTSESMQLHEKSVTLAEIMRDAGYATLGVFTGPFLLPRWGFGQGFDEYKDATRYDKSLEGTAMLSASERGRTTPGALEDAASMIRQVQDRPFFLFLHLFDPHPDFDPPPPYDRMFDPEYTGSVHGIDIMNNPDIHGDMSKRDLEHLVSLYDGEIRFVDDRGIDALLDLLAETALLDKTLIVITSDHGEEFFEHGVFGHRQNLYDTTLRIPLIFWCPRLIPQGKVITKQVRIIDVMPTILDLLELPQSPEGLGQSLQSFWSDAAGAGSDRPVFAEVKDWKLYLESLRMPEYKFIRDYTTNTWSLVNLKLDPSERDPLIEGEHEIPAEIARRFVSLRQGLQAYQKGLSWTSGVAAEMSPELRDRLRSLGYIK